MSTYTALIGDARSVGVSSADLTGISVGVGALNPQLAVARVRSIQNPHIVSDAVGGLISADFLIPAEEALRWRPLLRYGASVWMFDGGTPIFSGYAEQPVWTTEGDCQITLSGPWVVLGRARMREAWEIWDMSLLTRGIGLAENKSGQVNLNSDGTLTLSFPNGAVIALNDRVSVDYFLFGEAIAPADGKKLTAFEFDITDSQNLTANHRVRVFGKDTPSTGSTQLYDTAANGASGVQGATNLAGTNQGAAAWASTSGYRCLRFQIQFTAGATTAQDTYATFDRIRVGTSEALFPAAGGTMDTAAIARDILSLSTGGTGLSGLPFAGGTNVLTPIDVPPEFFVSKTKAGSPDTNSHPYFYGFDPVKNTTGAPNSGFGVTGFNALEWQSPAQILADLAAIDGSHVGFYLPYNGRGGYDAPGISGVPDVGSCWLTAPPQLYYQPFPDPTSAPDYTVHTREGAIVEPNPDAQPLIGILYANYQTNRGRQLSVVAADLDTRNYAFAQGYRRAEDYTIQPSAGNDAQATTLADQYMVQRRNPYATATITIENDGAIRYPILKAGAQVPRLAQIRPGSVRIVDVAASSGLRAGYATHVEWWGSSAGQNERVELTLAPPGRPTPARASRMIVNRYLRSRPGVFLR